MRRSTLSNRQKRILQFIESMVQEKGRPPTNREIGRAEGISSTGHVYHQLKILEKRGYLICIPNESRGIHLLKSVGLPVMGCIRTEQLLELYEAPGEHIVLERSGRYLLRVEGESFQDEGIHRGDYLVVDPAGPFGAGDLLIAWKYNQKDGAQGEIVFRRYTEASGGREQGKLFNSPWGAFSAPDQPEQTWTLVGKIVGVYRSYGAQ